MKRPTTYRCLFVSIVLWLCGSICVAQGVARNRWEKTIRSFEAQDRAFPPPKNEILFIGSSSIRLWDLTKSFPGVAMINRGFGGSEIADSIQFASRIILPYRPRSVVLYAGDNDVARGKTPATVLADFKTLVTLIHAELPRTNIVFIAIKPSIARWGLVETMRKANRAIDAFTETDERLSYVDIDTPMLGADGKPDAALFVDDGLHLNGAGYAIWGEQLLPHLRIGDRRAMDLRNQLAPRQPLETARLQPMEGVVVEFPSRIYGDRQPVAVCTTDLDDEPKPLIVELIPGTLSRVDRVVRECETVCGFAKKRGLGCVSIRPCGRGNGTVYQGYGEVDVYEAIEAVAQLVAIDRDRIVVTGVSMGGAATWYHASHRPDFWAAAAPFCGYCDYKLWEKPGGTTFHRQPWEEASWIARGAAYQAENFRHLPVRMTHGEWDRAVGGGVPVEHSRQMQRKLSALGYTSELIEVPKTGHGCRTPELWEDAVEWLLKQRRVAEPDEVSLVAYTLRHHRSYWVSVEQQELYGRASHVNATLDRDAKRVTVLTENVRRLSLGPLSEVDGLQLDASAFEGKDLLAQARSFQRGAGGDWQVAAQPIAIGEKRPQLSGPIGDLFYAPTIVVYGTSGADDETQFNRLMAGELVRFYNRYNGGVHRGGITGDNTVTIPIVSDMQALGQHALPEGGSIEVTAELIARANLLLIGAPHSNALLSTLGDGVSLRVAPDSLELSGREFKGEGIACFAIFPHPDGQRYVGLLSGTTPDSITAASHMGMQLLPDYIVFRQGEVLTWGFLDHRWQ